jgi:hypothetical protein
MSTMTILLLCLAAGSALHTYQILTVLAWIARGRLRRGPKVSATLTAIAEPLPSCAALSQSDKEVQAEPPPDAPQSDPERATALSA